MSNSFDDAPLWSERERNQATKIDELLALLWEWHDIDWKLTATECLPTNHIVVRTRAALEPAAQGTVKHPSPMNCDHSGSTYEQWTDGSVRFRCPKCGIDFTIRKDQNTDTQGAATPCGRDPCHMGLDGYCAKCHQEAYP